MTRLSKPVRRHTDSMVRDRGKWRTLVVTLYPNGVVGIRPAKTRTEETTTLAAIYDLAVKQRVAKEKADKKAKRRQR